MATPCHNDPDFISADRDAQARAAAACFDCPVFELCHEAGIGEPVGVWAGMTPDDPLRVAWRRDVRPAQFRGERCRNGHDLAVYGVTVHEILPSASGGVACRRCARLLGEIARRGDLLSWVS